MLVKKRKEEKKVEKKNQHGWIFVLGCGVFGIVEECFQWVSVRVSFLSAGMRSWKRRQPAALKEEHREDREKTTPRPSMHEAKETKILFYCFTDFSGTVLQGC